MEETKISIIDEIMQKSRYAKTDESYNIARMGVAAFVTEIVKAIGLIQR